MLNFSFLGPSISYIIKISIFGAFKCVIFVSGLSISFKIEISRGEALFMLNFRFLGPSTSYIIKISIFGAFISVFFVSGLSISFKIEISSSEALYIPIRGF